jgi:hypothetical protein
MVRLGTDGAGRYGWVRLVRLGTDGAVRYGWDKHRQE